MSIARREEWSLAITHQILATEDRCPLVESAAHPSSVSARVVDFMVAAVYSLLDYCGSGRLRENHFGTADLRWPARLGQARSVWFISSVWSIRSVSFVWLNKTNSMN